jgi:hypothetical protein
MEQLKISLSEIENINDLIFIAMIKKALIKISAFFAWFITTIDAKAIFMIE